MGTFEELTDDSVEGAVDDDDPTITNSTGPTDRIDLGANKYRMPSKTAWAIVEIIAVDGNDVCNVIVSLRGSLISNLGT